jgi:hypothetical protein
MPTLAAHLARSFAAHAPSSYTPTTEALLSPPNLLGYSPRADVCLTHTSGTRRVWIEFEISRADPVANHAKFAVDHGFTPQREGDVFISMMSTHVSAGRRNLGSAAILMMRRLGMSAFQTVLLPDFAPERIKALNHSTSEELQRAKLPIARELKRAFTVFDPVAEDPRYRIHFASDVGEVLLNARRFQRDLAAPDARARWGKRRIQYFVHDPLGGGFAPSKFCAFVPIPTAAHRERTSAATGFADNYLMSFELYADLDESEPRFDGHRARKHLEDRLLMTREDLDDAHELTPAFRKWLGAHDDTIAVRGKPQVLRLPSGFRSS